MGSHPCRTALPLSPQPIKEPPKTNHSNAYQNAALVRAQAQASAWINANQKKYAKSALQEQNSNLSAGKSMDTSPLKPTNHHQHHQDDAKSAIIKKSIPSTSSLIAMTSPSPPSQIPEFLGAPVEEEMASISVPSDHESSRRLSRMKAVFSHEDALLACGWRSIGMLAVSGALGIDAIKEESLWRLICLALGKEALQYPDTNLQAL